MTHTIFFWRRIGKDNFNQVKIKNCCQEMEMWGLPSSYFLDVRWETNEKKTTSFWLKPSVSGAPAVKIWNCPWCGKFLECVEVIETEKVAKEAKV